MDVVLLSNRVTRLVMLLLCMMMLKMKLHRQADCSALHEECMLGNYLELPCPHVLASRRKIQLNQLHLSRYTSREHDHMFPLHCIRAACAADCCPKMGMCVDDSPYRNGLNQQEVSGMASRKLVTVTCQIPGSHVQNPVVWSQAP